MQKQLDQFAARVFSPLELEVRGYKRSLHELVIMASMLEREEPLAGEPAAGGGHLVEAHRRGVPARRRRHQPLRAEAVERSQGVPGEAARRQRSVQHAPQEGPAAHADRRADVLVARGRAAADAERVPVLPARRAEAAAPFARRGGARGDAQEVQRLLRC